LDVDLSILHLAATITNNEERVEGDMIGRSAYQKIAATTFWLFG